MGDPVDRAEHLAVEEQHALVACRHGREVLLHHGKLLPVLRERLADRRRVLVVRPQEHHAGAPRAVERLDDGAPADLDDEDA